MYNDCKVQIFESSNPNDLVNEINKELRAGLQAKDFQFAVSDGVHYCFIVYQPYDNGKAANT